MKIKIKKGKFYKSLVGNEYIRVDGFDEDEYPFGVIFESSDNYFAFASDAYLEIAFNMVRYKETTEKEFYTALDLAREQFIRSFKAVKGGVL
ncbi:hypothetical protein [Capnocytophaga catalasegens]|uniref:Phage protein n=1 Tax=Capnocytophaga catalasegens TaxID=1004260 RepID=A0AAV5AVG0_9FLAO|nr:hypothetical protein [Capnocytophaga catalasegens]GIZ15752.1 hypothetical protein RCZ03_17520 [Capnocytophaga catalasegens]GJM49493.1 hypothetical protein RCZ15_04680 [Capnocytophaga catalasegens]GJM54245.1 hypothetical protein RCZ16_25610 [Capnocytophaga catalasegens]